MDREQLPCSSSSRMWWAPTCAKAVACVRAISMGINLASAAPRRAIWVVAGNMRLECSRLECSRRGNHVEGWILRDRDRFDIGTWSCDCGHHLQWWTLQSLGLNKIGRTIFIRSMAGCGDNTEGCDTSSVSGSGNIRQHG